MAGGFRDRSKATLCGAASSRPSTRLGFEELIMKASDDGCPTIRDGEGFSGTGLCAKAAIVPNSASVKTEVAFVILKISRWARRGEREFPYLYENSRTMRIQPACDYTLAIEVRHYAAVTLRIVPNHTYAAACLCGQLPQYFSTSVGDASRPPTRPVRSKLSGAFGMCR